MESTKRFRAGTWPHSLALAVVGVVLATLLFSLVHSAFPESDVVYLYLPVVALVAAVGDTRSGLLAAVLSFFVGKFFFVPRYYSLSVHDPKDWFALSVFLAIGLAMGIQTQRVRRREYEARTREQESSLLYRLSAFLALDPSAEGAVSLLRAMLQPALAVDRVTLLRSEAGGELIPTVSSSAERAPAAPSRAMPAVPPPSSPGSPPAAPSRAMPAAPPPSGAWSLRSLCSSGRGVEPVVVAQEAIQCLRAAESAQPSPPAPPPWEESHDDALVVRPRQDSWVLASGEVHLPLCSTSRVEGVLSLAYDEDDTGFPVRNARLLDALSRLVAGSMERARLQRLAAEAEALGEADRLKNVLISSVSHELRTPLAAVTASVTNLLVEDVEWDRAHLRGELEAVAEDLGRLNGSIGALLDLSRLESGAWQPARDWCDLGEMVGTTLKRLPRPVRARVQVELPQGLPALRVDFAQWVAALQNLMENALAYSPPETPVRLSAEVAQDGVRMWVEDRGPGVPDEEKGRVFEKFFRGRASSLRPAGTGLGLAITREIVEFHGGRVHVEDGPGCGARFVISLPITETRPEEVD